MSTDRESPPVQGGPDVFGLGDGHAQRQAIAEFLLANQDRVRAIARRKLSGPTRTVYDSEDVFASVLRRLDLMAQKRRLAFSSEDELWALIAVVTRNTALTKTQLIEQMRIRLTEDGPYAYQLLARLNACRDDDDAAVLVYRMMLSLPKSEDRQILALRLKGSSHGALAAAVGTSEQAMRQRWKRITDDLIGRFSSGELDG